jgi:hypothetical protein
MTARPEEPPDLPLGLVLKHAPPPSGLLLCVKLPKCHGSADGVGAAVPATNDEASKEMTER